MTEPEPDALDGPYRIEIARIQSVLDPFVDDVWGTGVITREGVALAIAEGRLARMPNAIWGGRFEPAYQAKPKAYDTERVAFLVVNPSADPICIEVVDPCGSTRFIDGCHRLAAAIYRGEPEILVTYGGYVDAFHRRFTAIIE